MSQSGSTMAAMLEKFAEFDRTASMLDMPRGERLNILNVSDDTYVLLRSGRIRQVGSVTPELERRLSYSLPLMRRLAKAALQSGAIGSGTGVRLQAA